MNKLPETREALRDARKLASDLKRMTQSYADYVAQRGADRSPKTAHQFALTMRHNGETFGHSVVEIILALEGQLPPYWEP